MESTMVNAAIEKYMEVSGKLPLGVAFGPVIDAHLPEVPDNVVCVVLPCLRLDSIVVMPLQALLDLVTATVVIMGEEDDE